jgi:hypothetical protein
MKIMKNLSAKCQNKLEETKPLIESGLSVCNVNDVKCPWSENYLKCPGLGFLIVNS